MVVLGANIAAMCAAEQPNVIKVDEQDHFHEDWVPPFDFRDGVRIRTTEKFSDYYDLYEEIGEGKFGKVYRCLEKRTNLLLAAKCIRLKRDADIEKVEKEVNIMTQMRHKCIAQIYDAFATTTNDVILIMEIVEGGELFDRVVDESYILTEMAVAMIVYQICEAIRYIHSQNIIHLDLKPENIMCLTQTGNQIKLIDFGLAQYYDGQSDLLFMAGTPEFAAPEVIKYEPLDFRTDMWSVGVITYILLSGQSPFLGENVAHTYCNVERGKWEFCEEFKDNCISQEAQDFISRLLIVDKNERMCPEDCLQHPWLVKFIELSRNNADQIIKEKPLDIGKLRSYVRNKRFRRLVFGVLFVNTIVRMMSTLQNRKSDHGIEYVKNMLSAVKNNNSTSNDNTEKNSIAKIFSKRKRDDEVTDNLPSTSTPATNLADDKVHTKTDSSNPLDVNVQTNLKRTGVKSKIDAKNHKDELSKSHSGEELHQRPKRINKCKETTENSLVQITGSKKTTSDALTAKGNIEVVEERLSKGNTSERLRSTSKKREIIEKKSKRVKSASRKTSSTEQAPNKRTKTSTSSHEIDSTESSASDTNTLPDKITPHNNEKAKELHTTSPPKLKMLSLFEQKVAESPVQFQLPVACAVLKKTANQSQMEKYENIENTTTTKIVIEPANKNDSTDNNKKTVLKKKILIKVKKPQKDSLTVDDERQKILSATKVPITPPAGSVDLTFNVKKELSPQPLTASENLLNIKNNWSKSPKIIIEDSSTEQNHLYSKMPRIYSHSDSEKSPKSSELDRQRLTSSPKSFFGVELKKTSNADKNDSHSIKNDKTNQDSLNENSNGNSKGLVGSLLKKLELNDASGIKIAVSGFIPPQIKRHNSADHLYKLSANSAAEKNNFQNCNKQKSTVLEDKIKESGKALCSNEKSFKLLPLKLESKTVSEQNIILAQKSTKQSTLVGKENDKMSVSLLDLNTLEISTMRKKLRSTKTINNNEKNESTQDQSKSEIKQINLVQPDSEVIDVNLKKSVTQTKANRVKIGTGKSVKVSSKQQLAVNEKFDLDHKQITDDVKSSEKIAVGNKSKFTTKAKISLGKKLEINEASISHDNETQSKVKVVDFNGNEEATDLSRKLVVKIPKLKKKLVKRSSVEKRKAMQRSLGSLTEQNTNQCNNDSLELIAEEGKTNVSFNEELLKDALEWTARSKHRSLTTLANKEHQELSRKQRDEFRPKSEINLSCAETKNQNEKVKSLQHIEKCDSAGTSFEHDAFDFSLLRMKLQQRIMGFKDNDDLATEAENRQKCELRVKLQSSANVKQTMKKWLNMDKRSSIHET